MAFLRQAQEVRGSDGAHGFLLALLTCGDGRRCYKLAIHSNDATQEDAHAIISQHICTHNIRMHTAVYLCTVHQTLNMVRVSCLRQT